VIDVLSTVVQVGGLLALAGLAVGAVVRLARTSG
jgi:hypothetical protein